MTSTLKIAFIYKSDYIFLSENHFDKTTYYFFMKALKRNKKIEVSYFPAGNSFDTSKLKGKYDIILLPNNNNDGTPDDLIGIKNVGIPVICRTGDPHWAKKYDQFRFHTKYKIDYYFNFMHKNYFYKFYPKHFNYKSIILGLELNLYKNVKPFNERIFDKILNSGAIGKTSLISIAINAIINPKRSGWYFYKLRTKCNKLPYVDHTGMVRGKYINEDYPHLLSRYSAAIAATTFYPTVKYWEIAGAGCLNFMEITEKNRGNYLGFKDNESAIFINEKNYEEKFESFLTDPKNSKWREIADSGRNHAINNLSNDKAVNDLIKLMEELVH